MEKFFYQSISTSMEIEVPESVYFPHEDSLMLAKALESIAEELGGKSLLEIGCGSGLISILAAKLGAVVTATDINPEAVEAAIQNAKANSVQLNAFASDLFANVKGSFDFIIFNAPYLPDQDGDMPENFRTQWSIHQNGNVIERFAREAKSHLSSKGRILILFSSLSGDIMKLLKENGFEARILSRKKLDFEELFVVEGKKK